MKITKIAVLLFAASALLGCQSTTKVVDQSNDTNVVMGINYKDFNAIANTAAESLISSPALIHPRAAEGGVFVGILSDFTNDTMVRIDTDSLTNKFRMKVLNSGRMVFTSMTEEQMIANIRKLEQSKLVNKKTAKKDGTVISADFALAGKISQRNHTLDNGDQQVEYVFTLAMTDLRTGLQRWIYEDTIVKQGDGSTVSW
ncbi:penicillin-binding protein activator LpoB [Aliivibrio kagoshimensis]|uniref:penicillin-binding protein activator LpoB n=1 Tax=Aliivibrio kagoshimensis TaxID=2910230 RepID=UPI003D096B00